MNTCNHSNLILIKKKKYAQKKTKQTKTNKQTSSFAKDAGKTVVHMHKNESRLKNINLHKKW